MLGPHVLQCSDATMRWASKAPVIKQAFGTDVLKEAKQLNPSIITICRPIWMLTTNAVDAADAIIAKYNEWQFIPDYTELWNESDELGQNLGIGLERRLELHQVAVPILVAAGIKVAGFSFSVGQPQQADIEYLAANGWAGVSALALHEYWFSPVFDTWTALRYRRIKEWAGIIPPIIITECGRHYAGPEDWGWKKCDISAAEYANELKAYAAELTKDGINGVVFTASNDPQWDSFDTDPIADLIGEEMPFQVGQGILTAMTEHGEVPVEDEHYLWPNLYSICASAKALYTYSFSANQVYRSPLA